MDAVGDSGWRTLLAAVVGGHCRGQCSKGEPSDGGQRMQPVMVIKGRRMLPATWMTLATMIDGVCDNNN